MSQIVSWFLFEGSFNSVKKLILIHVCVCMRMYAYVCAWVRVSASECVWVRVSASECEWVRVSVWCVWVNHECQTHIYITPPTHERAAAKVELYQWNPHHLAPPRGRLCRNLFQFTHSLPSRAEILDSISSRWRGLSVIQHTRRAITAATARMNIENRDNLRKKLILRTIKIIRS